MREILFRAKSGNEWVYGDVVHLFSNDNVIIVHAEREGETCNYVDIVLETVGQYIGLKDKNLKKIFEGDVVKVIYITSDGEETTEITVVQYDETDCCFYPLRWNESCEWCDYYTEIQEIEVIGNIHDNPELLKDNINE